MKFQQTVCQTDSPARVGVTEFLSEDRGQGQGVALVKLLVGPLEAGAVVLTGRALAFVHVYLAVFAGVAGVALALVVFDVVHAESAIYAGLRQAVVDVLLAAQALEIPIIEACIQTCNKEMAVILT